MVGDVMVANEFRRAAYLAASLNSFFVNRHVIRWLQVYAVLRLALCQTLALRPFSSPAYLIEVVMNVDDAPVLLSFR
jgi:hypothetical protein